MGDLEVPEDVSLFGYDHIMHDDGHENMYSGVSEVSRSDHASVPGSGHVNEQIPQQQYPDYTEVMFLDSVIDDMIMNGFQNSRHNVVFIEGLPGVGKTALLKVIADRVQERVPNNPNYFPRVALRGVVARLSGSQTVAKLFDQARKGGFGSEARGTSVTTHNHINQAGIIGFDEYEESSGQYIDVSRSMLHSEMGCTFIALSTAL